MAKQQIKITPTKYAMLFASQGAVPVEFKVEGDGETYYIRIYR